MMILRAGFILLLFSGLAAAAAGAPAVVEYPLGDGVRGVLDEDGTVELGVLDGGVWRPLLTARWPRPDDPRGVRPRPFTATAREGDPGGRRGFSRDADDDGDGLIDEDPLDGRDNDGDGLIDEDYAAISHLMGVWDLTAGERGRRLETYHWTYQGLSSLMVAVFSQHGGGPVESLRLSLPEPLAWLPLDEMCVPREAAARAPQFLARTADPRPGGSFLWVGAVLLDLEPRRRADQRVRIEQGDLVVPPIEARQALALAVGPTRLQVVEDLAAAVALQDGVTDHVSGQRVRWLPPVRLFDLPDDLLPAAVLEEDAPEEFRLVLRTAAEHYRRWDPDLFRVDGTSLGAPVRLVWTADDSRRRSLVWSHDRDGLGDTCGPYAALAAGGAGTLEFHFEGQAPPEGERLGMVHIDGRRIEIELERAEPVAVEAAAAAAPGERRAQLSPALLATYPNPFHASTRIGFQVPETYGEAFLQEEGREAPFDPQQRMPYADGAASVQVSIYSLEGRDIVTLYAGLSGVGAYETQWDGRDREGRLLASGTYFCRLQVEQWSVTRRVIFIR